MLCPAHRAFCAEAQALVPGIETVEVKHGVMPGAGDECNTREYAARNTGAIHIHPVRARAKIREGAERAVRRFKTESFGLIPLHPPFKMTKRFRAFEDQPPVRLTGSHPTSVIELFRTIPVDPPSVSAKKRKIKPKAPRT